MKIKLLLCFSIGLLFFGGTHALANGVKPMVNSSYADAAPVVDGIISGGEWPESSDPSIYISSPIETYVFVVNNEDSVYFLVDAIGDTTQDDFVIPESGELENRKASAPDHCDLQLYNNGKGFLTYVIGQSIHTIGSTAANLCSVAELVFGSVTNLSWSPIESSLCQGDAIAGFGTSLHSSTPHRIYEFRVPLDAFNAVAGDKVLMASALEINSLPFDSEQNLHNYWPSLSASWTDLTSWGELQLSRREEPIPTISEWGMIIMSILLAGVALLRIRRQDL